MSTSDKNMVLSNAVRLANSGKLPYEARLQAIVELIARSLPILSAAVYLVDEDRRYLTRKISTIIATSPSVCEIPLGEGISGRCASKKEPVMHPASYLHADEWRTGNENSFIALPLLDERRLYGVLTLGTDECITFSPVEHELLDDLVAVLSGVAISFVITQWADRRTVMMSQITDLVKILNRSLHPDVLVPQVLQACHRVTDSCFTVLRLFPNDNGIPEGIFHKSKYRFRSHADTFLHIEDTCHKRVAATGFPVLITDLISEDDIPPSYICVPLLFESLPLGTLTLFGKSGEGLPPSNFNEEERELFFNLATLMANALESGANYQKMELLSHRNREKVQELSLLYRVSNIMLSTIKLNELVSLVLTALTAGKNPFFDRAMLLLINENERNMQGMMGVTTETAGDEVLLHGEEQNCPWCLPGGIEKELARQIHSEFNKKVRATRMPLAPERNVCSQAISQKKLIHVPDVDALAILDRDFVDNFGIRAFAAAPLVAKEQVVGIVVVDNSLSGRAIKEDELRFLQLFTNQAGTAIENSILYSRLESANKELCEAQERLIQGERLAAIGEMAASIAHEVKGPLVSIGGFARRLVKKSLPESDEWRCADTISREVTRLEHLLTDILSYSKKTSICFTECSVVAIIEESLTLVLHTLEENRIRVRKHFEGDLPTFPGDNQQLKQVFLNLLMNAQEAMKGGGEIEIHVKTAHLDGAPAIAATIKDSGKGIPPEIIATIFNPFFTTKATGTGLGLPIVHRIVTNHLGRIEVSNHPAGGAVFTVTLPLSP